MIGKIDMLEEKLSSIAAIGAFTFFMLVQVYGWYLALRAMAA